MLQCTCELIGATGAAAFAIDPLQAGDDIGLFHSNYQSANPLRIAVTPARVADAANDVPFQFNVQLLGTNGVTGLERGFLQAVFLGIGKEGNFKHRDIRFVLSARQIYLYGIKCPKISHIFCSIRDATELFSRRPNV